MVSLMKGASLVGSFVLNVIVNSTLKWAFQRPRPKYLSAREGIANIRDVFERDFSFPSGHTQVISASLTCLCGLFDLPWQWHATAVLLGILAAFSRNYLAVHWCSDTAAGLLLGCAIGFAWGRYDPHRYVLHSADPWFSLISASILVGGLGAAQTTVRRCIPPIETSQADEWFSNAISDLSPEKRCKLMGPSQELLQLQRDVNSPGAIPALTTLWCVFSSTAWYAQVPASELEFCLGSAHTLGHILALRALLGIAGLAVWTSLILGIKKCFNYDNACFIAVLNCCAFAGISYWILFFAPVTFNRVGLHCTR